MHMSGLVLCRGSPRRSPHDHETVYGNKSLASGAIFQGRSKSEHGSAPGCVRFGRNKMVAAMLSLLIGKILVYIHGHRMGHCGPEECCGQIQIRTSGCTLRPILAGRHAGFSFNEDKRIRQRYSKIVLDRWCVRMKLCKTCRCPRALLVYEATVKSASE